MSRVFIEVYEISEDEAKVPVQSAISLFLLDYLQYPPNVSVSLVVSKGTEPSLSVSIRTTHWQLVTEDNLCPPVSDCFLPVFTTPDSNVCVAGLCAVLRQVIKHSGEKWKHLLGFREGCLFACAEVSLWTKFCEIDIVQSVHDILVINQDLSEIKIPENFARFEEHLKQPVRVHNVDKLRKEGQNCIEHAFAEGPSLSLADLIIVPCVHLVFHALPGLLLSGLLSTVVQWYQTVISEPQVLDALNVIKTILPLVSTRFYTVPEVPKHSLYKSDPKRYKPKLKQFTCQEDVEEALRMVETMKLNLEIDLAPLGHDVQFDWETISDGIQPDVPQSRLERKQQQLENLIKPVIKIAKAGDRIVDFCCGSGHLGILVAHCLPQCEVVLLDNKEQSLDRARARVASLGLLNITIIQTNIDYFTGSFQIGMSLHACGVASDLVIESCLRETAAFVICPCCYGSLQSNHMVSYPRSGVLSSVPFRYYLVLGHCADQTHGHTYAKSEQGERCMAIIDTDRCLRARELGYVTSLGKLVPQSCTPKNNLLVGVPSCTASVTCLT